MKRFLLAWGIVNAVLVLWAALANIAPDMFVIRGNPLPGWARGQNLAWLTIPVIVAWLVIAFLTLWRRLDKLESWAQDRETAIAESSKGLKVISRTADGTTSVVLGEREFDLGPGAHDYFKRQNAENQAKLLRFLRRQFLKRRFTREDLIVEVDEAQRLHIRLDGFIGTGRSFAETIEAEVSRRQRVAELPPPPEPRLSEVLFGRPTIAAGLMPAPPNIFDFKFQQIGADIQRWQDEVYEFLKRERPGFAEEFQRPLEPPGEVSDPLAILLNKIKDLIERLVHIKRQV